MDYLEMMMIAGLCLMGLAAAFIFRAIFKTAKLRREGQRYSPPGARLDLYLGALWSGLLLVQLSSLVRHMEPPGPHNLSWLSLTGFASIVFLCGAYAGRLSLRMEIQRQQSAGAMT